MAQAGGSIIKFDSVSFDYGPGKTILDSVDFSVRQGTKTVLMGQNGAGKSTIFKLITGEIQPDYGSINLQPKLSIAIARQVIARDQLDMTVREFFQACFKEKIYDIDPRIDAVMETVNLPLPDHDKVIRSFSGGQQARLLLASALIQNPDILLLDEPTNNLDTAGIEHLTQFLIDYKKTCLVISHDAEFLNAFTDGVLYLDVFTQKIEMYVGNYHDVVEQIKLRVEKERRENARLEKEIIANKEKANFFANKGGNLRAVAKRMREKAEEYEENKIDVRREDKTIRNFIIPCQENALGNIITITSFAIMKNNKIQEKKADVVLKKKNHLLLSGPNGIGKTTLLESMARGTAEGAKILPGIRVGYYRQDFSTLDFNHTVWQSLAEVMDVVNEEELRKVAANFLIMGNLMNAKVSELSEGQKGLLSFARLVLLKPGLLILDEPTNHINFRHLPVIAKALSQYEGAMILVSHVPEFVDQIRIDEKLDLGK